MNQQTGRIFRYGGQVGTYCGTVAPAFRFSSKKGMSILICPLGRVFRLYNVGSGLRFMSQSNELPSDIKCIAADPMYVYAADATAVYSFHLAKQIDKIFKTESGSGVHLLLPMGESLLGVDTTNALAVWDLATTVVDSTFEFDPSTFEITAVHHPATYLNKVLVGSRQGQLRLLNVRTGKNLFTFKGWNSAVLCLQQSTAVDVMAIGLRSGDIHLHDIKHDEAVMKFGQDFGPVSHIVFRTDGPQMMITGSLSGDISVWNLDKRRVVHQAPQCHGKDTQCKLTGLFVVPSEPIFVTSSDENALKSWIFDQPDDSFRLYHCLQGHPSPPAIVRFHGNVDELILTTGAADSTVKLFSTSKLTKYYNLGTATTVAKKTAKRRNINFADVKLPPITCIASDTARESGWDNVVCCHKGDVRVTTWTTRKLRRGSHVLMHDRFRTEPALSTAVATCCCVTACGNFTFIGYSSGHVDMYNIQSGKFRGELEHNDRPAHEGPVVGVATNALNTTVVSVGEDCRVKIWTFTNRLRQLQKSVRLQLQPSFLRVHRGSNLMAVALADMGIVLMDLTTSEIVRRFPYAHQAKITDMTFSASGYWLVSASADCTIKTWDIPTGKLVDAMVCDNPCTSVCMSPVDNLLATTHTHQKGATLWLNRTLFQQVSLAPIDQAAFDADEMVMETETPMITEVEDQSRDQIENLLTVSNLPPSRWAHLMSLDIIRQRNKPKEPPKKPKAAPFFLPTVAGLDPKFDVPTEGAHSSSKILSLSADGFRSDLCKSLARSTASENPDFSEPFELLKSWGPSRIESEIQSLGPLNDGSVDILKLFLMMTVERLQEKRDFDLVQSYLSVLLKAHRELLSTDAGLRTELQLVKAASDPLWQEVDVEFDGCLNLMNYFKSSTL